MVNCRAVFGIILCSFETLVITGLIYGWFFIVPVFRHSGITYCPKEDTTSPRFKRDVLDNVEIPLNKEINDRGNISPPFRRGSALFYSDQLIKYNTVVETNETGIIESSIKGLLFEDIPKWECQSAGKMYKLMWTLCMFIPMVFICLAGILYDIVGTRATRIVAILFMVAGSLMVAFTDGSAYDRMLIAGMVILCMGGAIILMTNFQLANYYSFLDRSLILSYFVGLHCAGAGIFLVFNALYINFIPMVTMKYLFFGLTGFLIIPCITTIAIFPNSRIEWTDGEGLAQQYSHIRMNSRNIYKQNRLEGFTMDPLDREILEEESRSIATASLGWDEPSYWKTSCSAHYVLHVFWYAILQIQYWYIYWRNIINNNWDDNTTLDYRIPAFQFGQIAMFFVALLIGLIMDELRRKMSKKYKERETISVKAASPIVLVTTCLITALAGITFLDLIDSNKKFALYAEDGLLAFVRPVALTVNVCLIFQTFPNSQFGRLYGVVLLVGGAFGILFYPLDVVRNAYRDAISFNSIDDIWIRAGIGGLVLLSWIYPIYLCVHGYQLEKLDERRLMCSLVAADNSVELNKSEDGRNGSAPSVPSTTEF